PGTARSSCPRRPRTPWRGCSRPRSRATPERRNRQDHGAQVDFELTEEQAALRELSRGMLAVSCPPQLVRSLATSGTDVDDKLWQRGTELGWTGLAVPQEHDGAGQGLVELCLVAEELGRAAAPGPFADSALAGLVLARLGRPELLAALAAGDLKASL